RRRRRQQGQAHRHQAHRQAQHQEAAATVLYVLARGGRVRARPPRRPDRPLQRLPLLGPRSPEPPGRQRPELSHRIPLPVVRGTVVARSPSGMARGRRGGGLRAPFPPPTKSPGNENGTASVATTPRPIASTACIIRPARPKAASPSRTI